RLQHYSGLASRALRDDGIVEPRAEAQIGERKREDRLRRVYLHALELQAVRRHDVPFPSIPSQESRSLLDTDRCVALSVCMLPAPRIARIDRRVDEPIPR